MKKIVFIFIGLFIIFTVFYYYRNPLHPVITINGHKISVELALTDSERQLGLGKRKFLPPDSGMIFIYPTKEQYSFWMKDMEFPLDFVWIDDNIVTEINENVPIFTNGKITILRVSKPVNKILELNAGTVNRLNIKVGDPVSFKN
jgi:uncharacterized protein